MDKERKKWRTISRIIIDVIFFLSKQNLSFRGHREDLRLKVAIVKTLIHKTRYLSWNCEANCRIQFCHERTSFWYWSIENTHVNILFSDYTTPVNLRSWKKSEKPSSGRNKGSNILLNLTRQYSWCVLCRSDGFIPRLRKSWGKWSTNKGVCFSSHCTWKRPNKLLILFSMSFMQMTWTWWRAEVKLMTMLP